MKTNKSHLFPFIIIGIFLATLATSCKSEDVEGYPVYDSNFGYPILNAEENKDHNLVLVMQDKKTIIIELQDEQEDYIFAFRGVEYKVRYFRIGDERNGTTGVFIMWKGDVFKIRSPWYGK